MTEQGTEAGRGARAGRLRLAPGETAEPAWLGSCRPAGPVHMLAERRGATMDENDG